MPRHLDSLVSFDVPRDWQDKTIIAYTAPPAEGQKTAANLVMTRDRLGDDEDLYAYAERHVDELAKQLRGFAMLGSRDEEVGGHPALSVSFNSEALDGALTQKLTMVLLTDRVVASFTLTSPERDLSQLAPLFERIMSTVSFAGEQS